MFKQNISLGPGTESFTAHTFEILIMLLGAFLLGLWLGWVLWSRYRQMVEKMRLDNESLAVTVNSLRADLDALKIKLNSTEEARNEALAQAKLLSEENNDFRERLNLLQADLNSLLDRNTKLETELGLSYAPEPEPDDIPLEITTATEMTPVEIEDAAVPAAENTDYIANQMVALDEPAYELPTDHFSDEAFADLANSAEEALPILAFPGQQDDLKIVEGIGPKIEELLFKSDINSYAELAATPVQRLKEILAEAGPRFAMHDPGTWSAQALLAANGEWENLKAYQDFLNAGKRP